MSVFDEIQNVDVEIRQQDKWSQLRDVDTIDVDDSPKP
jgi:hypothetical protein